MGAIPEDAIAYDGYIGRWSRVVAREFLAWLAIPTQSMWHDVACGTGALTSEALASYDPARIDGSDPDETRIAHARTAIVDARAHFVVGDGMQIAGAGDRYDAVVNGLGFPPIRDTVAALVEFRRVAKPGGTVAGYVWDFDGEMQLLRYFWNAAADLDAGVEDVTSDDGDDPYAICAPEKLSAAWTTAGFSAVSVRAIDAHARFANFDDFWMPFQRGDSPAQRHVASLDEDRRAHLRSRLHDTLPIASDGSIALVTRAWAAKGVK